MNSAAQDIANVIEGAGHGTIGADAGWSIAIGTYPSDPITAITVFDTGGLGPDTDQEDLLRPSFMVQVRSETFSSGYAKLFDIGKELRVLGNLVVEQWRYVYVRATSDILPLGKNEAGHFEFSLNFEAMRHET